MEALITVDCAIKTSRKRVSSPEEPLILEQFTQITHLSEDPSPQERHSFPETQKPTVWRTAWCGASSTSSDVTKLAVANVSRIEVQQHMVGRI